MEGLNKQMHEEKERADWVSATPNPVGIMASSFSTVKVNVPFSSVKATQPSKWPTFPSMGTTQRAHASKSLKAMTEGKDNLDHLQFQRATLPKKRTVQAAPVGLWDRFPTARTVQQMMDTMERMLDDPLAYNGTWPSVSSSRERNGYRRGRTPWDIKERKEDYRMRFDMPGMTREDVKVYVEQNMLVVKAEKVPKVNKGDQAHVEEGTGEDTEEWSADSFGKYSTRIALPENVEFEKIAAEVKNGVLYITVPKASSTSKILDINVE